MASVNLSGILSGVGSLLGANSATTASDLATTIVQNMAIGAIGAAGLAALQHPDVKSALLPFDPLNLAGKPASLNPTPAAAPVATPAATHGVTLAQATSLGWVVNGVPNLPAGVVIVG